MRRIHLTMSIMLFFIFFAVACKPGIDEGEHVNFSKENLQKYWKSVSINLADDTLVMVPENAAMVSKFKVKNFTLTAEMLTTRGAEGTIAFHTASDVDSTLTGYAVKINNNDYRSGSPQKSGSLMHIRNNYVRLATDDKWFTLKVEVNNNRISVFINDKVVSDYIQSEHPQRVEGLENMLLSEGYLKIQKTNGEGSIVIGKLALDIHSNDIKAVSDSAFIFDSTGEMLTVLNQKNFPVIDFHGHLKGGLTVDQVSEHGRLHGYNFGLAPNCGLNFPVTNDSSLIAYYEEMAPEPVFKAMQCEGREWITLFTPRAIEKYDYIFTDAMTWTDHKGRRMRLWIPEETFVDNEQQFMDMLVGKIEAVLSQEPVDIYVNPTYLPEIIAAKYDELWTPERMNRVIRALVDNDVALEINSRFKIPSLEFVKLARKAGVKFTLGTNNAGNDDLGRLEYSLQIIRDAGITPEEMFLPRPTGKKKVIEKGLPAKITG